MEKKQAKYKLDTSDYEKPRCRACGSEVIKVLIRYPTGLVDEWECLQCGKSFKVGSYQRKPERHRRYSKYRR